MQSAFNSEDNHVVPLLPEPTIHPTDLGARRHGCNATLARNLASRVHSSNVIGLQIRYFQPPMRASVVIPCYRPDANFEKMLGDLNAQTCQDFDVVLADDGNTPPLAARVKATLKRPHRVIRFEQNRGIVAGLNACIADVRAPVVIRMDADDRMPPDRIERQLAYLDNHPEVDVVGASMAVFGSGLRMWTKPTSHHDICASLLWAPGLNHPTVAARTQVLQDHPYEEGHHLAEDYALWLALAQQGATFANDPFCAVYYRMEGQNTSQNGAQARLERYVSMHQHAIHMLLPHADAAELTPGLTNGAHQVLAGMCALHDPKSPGLDKVKQHAEALLRALEAHGERHPEDAWIQAAQHATRTRLARVEANTRWHKLEGVRNLRLLRVSDWLALLRRDR